MIENIKDKYDIIKSIGEGSSAAVFLGQNKVDKKYVAIKKISLQKMPKWREHKEAEILKKLKQEECPYVVEWLDFGKDDANYYIVTKLCEYGSLRHIIKRLNEKKMNCPIILVNKFLVQIAQALKTIHSKNIVHRDLKSDNILITDGYDIKICDFGIYFEMPNNQPQVIRSFAGTPNYMAPEIFESNCFSFKTDIWGFGVILYEMLTGKVPFSGCNQYNLARNVINNPYDDVKIDPYPLKINTDPLKKLLLQMLQKSPDFRPTAEEILKNSYVTEIMKMDEFINIEKYLKKYYCLEFPKIFEKITESFPPSGGFVCHWNESPGPSPCYGQNYKKPEPSENHKSFEFPVGSPHYTHIFKSKGSCMTILHNTFSCYFCKKNCGDKEPCYVCDDCAKVLQDSKDVIKTVLDE